MVSHGWHGLHRWERDFFLRAIRELRGETGKDILSTGLIPAASSGDTDQALPSVSAIASPRAPTIFRTCVPDMQ